MLKHVWINLICIYYLNLKICYMLYTLFLFSYHSCQSSFLKFKRFKLIHLRWPPAVRIKSCLLSYTFRTIWLPWTKFKWRYKNEGNSYHTRTKFVPKLPTKKLQTSITAFHCWQRNMPHSFNSVLNTRVK